MVCCLRFCRLTTLHALSGDAPTLFAWLCLAELVNATCRCSGNRCLRLTGCFGRSRVRSSLSVPLSGRWIPSRWKAASSTAPFLNVKFTSLSTNTTSRSTHVDLTFVLRSLNRSEFGVFFEGRILLIFTHCVTDFAFWNSFSTSSLMRSSFTPSFISRARPTMMISPMALVLAASSIISPMSLNRAPDFTRRCRNEAENYLSFENSLCRDYVTEKLWRILTINVVPVVLGKVNYSAILPPHSYIDVRDFASPRHLADYLKLLSSNDTLYNEYFRWRAKYNCGSFPFKQHDTACDLCRHAVATRGKTEIVKDLVAEWGRNQNCISPKQYYRGMDSYI